MRFPKVTRLENVGEDFHVEVAASFGDTYFNASGIASTMERAVESALQLFFSDLDDRLAKEYRRGYEDGTEDGRSYDSGYNHGYEEGYEAGRVEGFEDGRETGFREGLQEAKTPDKKDW